ncbi:MAG: hypothetical protein IJC97_00595 [Oscillospiraceae bacterium]|nr:hypothetical protein [Oscillospiraceae bacterium]
MFKIGAAKQGVPDFSIGEEKNITRPKTAAFTTRAKMKAEKLKPKTASSISEELRTDYFEFFTPRPDAKIYQKPEATNLEQKKDNS